MAYNAAGSSGRELSDYRSLLQRRWRWIAAGLALGLVGAWAYLQLATPTYVSTAEVRVFPPPLSGAPGDGTDSINMDTEAQVVTSQDVAGLARDIAGDRVDPSLSAREMPKRVDVTVPPNSELLDISFSAESAAQAQAGAQAFAEAYVADREADVQGVIDANVAELQERQAQIKAALREIIAELNSTKDPPRGSRLGLLEANRASLNSELNLNQTNLNAYQGTVGPLGDVNNPAERPSGPDNPKPLLVVPSGLMLGLLLGLGLASVRERTDRRLHASSDVERVFNLPVLAQLNPRKTSLAAMQPGERLDHDLRALFHSVEAASPEGAQLVLVVNPTLAQPAGEVARALCLVAARTGARTSYLTRMAGSETLLGAAWRRNGNRSDLDITNYIDVAVVAEGEIRPNALQTALARLRRERDFVVLDMPTGDPVIDIPVIARHADVVLVAVELGRTARSDLSHTLTLLLRSGATNICAVTIRRGRRAPQPTETGEELQKLPDVGQVLHPPSGSQAYQRRSSDPRSARRPPSAG